MFYLCNSSNGQYDHTNISSLQGAERKIRDEEKKQLRKKTKGPAVGNHDGESSVNQPYICLYNIVSLSIMCLWFYSDHG